MTGAAKYQSLSYGQQLAKAQALYAADIGKPELSGAAATAKPAIPAPTTPKPQRPTPPPTLARTAAAAETDTGDPRTAALDRIMSDGTTAQRERALANMTADEREAWGSSGD